MTLQNQTGEFFLGLNKEDLADEKSPGKTRLVTIFTLNTDSSDQNHHLDLCARGNPSHLGFGE
tara:strand:+ start:301 stop:489 length:189 start_codon:yes stop_codon:yes gene_type:complete